MFGFDTGAPLVLPTAAQAAAGDAWQLPGAGILSPFDLATGGLWGGGKSTLMPAAQWPGEGAAVSGTLTGLAGTALKIFGAAAPSLFATDPRPPVVNAAYGVPAGGAGIGGLDPVMLGLLAVGALAAVWVVTK
jgi:hypothetical protein